MAGLRRTALHPAAIELTISTAASRHSISGLPAAPGQTRSTAPYVRMSFVADRLSSARSDPGGSARPPRDCTQQGQGLGRAPLRGALQRVLQASERVGIALIAVHALSERAKQFYLDCGSKESPLGPMTLLARLADVVDAGTEADNRGRSAATDRCPDWNA